MTAAAACARTQATCVVAHMAKHGTSAASNAAGTPSTFVKCHLLSMRREVALHGSSAGTASPHQRRPCCSLQRRLLPGCLSLRQHSSSASAAAQCTKPCGPLQAQRRLCSSMLRRLGREQFRREHVPDIAISAAALCTEPCGPCAGSEETLLQLAEEALGRRSRGRSLWDCIPHLSWLLH